MSDRIYFQIEITSSKPLSDELLSFLQESSPLGIWLIDEKSAKVFFKVKPEDLKKNLKRRFPFLKIKSGEFKDRNWVKEYEMKLKPIEIGKKFLIVHFSSKSKIKKVKSENRIVIKLIPSEAFGTGEHFTTSSSIKMLETISPMPEKVLDIGTGSGILAIASSKLSARYVVGFDIDFDSVKVAKESSSLNDSPIFVLCSSVEAIKGKFKLVIANILAETLIELSDEIDRVASRRSKLILSGIAKEKEKDVLKVYEEKGFKLKRKISDKEWVTLLCSR
jgi:ribosomal protein L11 methyltransferase